MKATNQYNGVYRNSPPTGVKETIITDCMMMGFFSMFFLMLFNYESLGLGVLIASIVTGILLYLYEVLR